MNQRQKSLIYQLIESNSYITTKALADSFNVSERTIHSDLNKIEAFLTETQLPLAIQRKKEPVFYCLDCLMKRNC